MQTFRGAYWLGRGQLLNSAALSQPDAGSNGSGLDDVLHWRGVIVPAERSLRSPSGAAVRAAWQLHIDGGRANGNET